MFSTLGNLFARGVLILSFAAGFAGTALAFDYTGIPEGGEIRNRIYMDGRELGTHEVRFTRLDDMRLQVDTEIRMRYALAFITLFRYEHTSQEIWEDGRLVSLNSMTNDDGTQYYVRLTRNGEGILAVDASENRGTNVPAGIIPTSYWNIALADQKQLLSTQSGKVFDVDVSDLGLDVLPMSEGNLRANRYRVGGELNVDLWYDENDLWVGTAFEVGERKFTYKLMEPKIQTALSAD